MGKVNYDEVIVYVIRKTGWPLDYVRSMNIRDLKPFVEELKHQEGMKNYRLAYPIYDCFAMLFTAFGKRRYTAEDFMGEMPQRKLEEVNIWQAAEKAGIRVPSRRA